MTVYYNEPDPYAAEWLRRLMIDGHIAWGDVDERSIRDVQADDLTGYTQCHFFAGIGVWSHALRRAGWPDDKPVWTGSCPCQPFSAAGQQKGFDDERHLWPVWFRLIEQRRPAIVLGEQVASALDWLDLVSADMEGAGYAFGASDLCAAGFGGAHIRQRLYFVAVADADGSGQQGQSRSSAAQGFGASERSGVCRLADADGRQSGQAGAIQPGRQHGQQPQDDGALPANRTSAPMLGRNPADWLYCRDGKWRPVEPGTFPLVDAAPARVGRLRAYGNALDAETAAQFCGAVMECL